MGMVPFKRTMARVEDGQRHWVYRCMECARRMLPSRDFDLFSQGIGVTVGSGMERGHWVLVQVCAPCASCDA